MRCCQLDHAVSSRSCETAPSNLLTLLLLHFFFFFFNDTATTEIYTLSLHDALPIFASAFFGSFKMRMKSSTVSDFSSTRMGKDRKSTRLNSSHVRISYAVFCLKKNNHNHTHYSHAMWLLTEGDRDGKGTR